MFVGREAELRRFDELAADIKRGVSRVLVLRGEAGIGKTALLDEAASRSGGMTVIRATGVESESHLPYAGLHLLLQDHLHRIDDLPARQAEALAAAVGLGGRDGDQFLVGLGALTLLAEIAVDEPLLCLVDDVQWLDPESTVVLGFVARRLRTEGVGLVFAVREPTTLPAIRGLPDHLLTGLDSEESEALLAAVAPQLGPPERERLVRIAGGNPLALRSVAHPAHPAHESPPAGPRSLVQHEVARVLTTAPDAARALLVVAAADDTGDVATVLRAAEPLGGGMEELAWAEEQGLLNVALGRVTYDHSLVRAAIYQAAPLNARIEAHRALAGVLAAAGDDDRCAWHLAAAAVVPDEEVAAALEATGNRAAARGAHATSATAYQRAARLSTSPLQTQRRTLLAARGAAEAGELDRARDLLHDVGEARDEVLGSALELRARLAEARGRADEAVPLLVQAAGTAEPIEAARFYLRAVDAAWTANDFAAIPPIVARAVALPDGASVKALADVALAVANPDEGSPGHLVHALRTLVETQGDDDLWTLPQRAWWALTLGDLDLAFCHARAVADRCRQEGSAGPLPHALAVMAHAQFLLGRHLDARSSATEGIELAEATGHREAALHLELVLGTLDALAGHEHEALAQLRRVLESGRAPLIAWATAALGLLDLTMGRFEDAMSRSERFLATHHPMNALEVVPVMAEAAWRVGRPRVAEPHVLVLTRWAARTGQPWLQAIAARSTALVTGDLRHFEDALELGGHPFERARTELLYAESRRRGTPVSREVSRVRDLLRGAGEAFDSLGAQPWAARARAELRATGVSTTMAATDGHDPLDSLTPQELQVVRLAAQGLTNREIGAQLFLSPRTVGNHLYTAFPKLGISSRGQLAALLRV